jgi:hypothetical protein
MFNNNAFYVAFWTEGFGNTDHCPADINRGFEADILEGYDSSYEAHVHWGGYGACNVLVSSPGDSGPDNDMFHIIGMKWDPPDGLRFYKDGVEQYHLAGPIANTGTDVRFSTMAVDDTRGPLQVDWFRYYRAQ